MHPVRLAEALESTLKNHPLLRLQERQVYVNEGALQSATGRFDMAVSAGVFQNRLNTPLTASQHQAAAGAGIFTNNRAADMTNYSGGLSKQFRNGISISPGLQADRNVDNLQNLTGLNNSRLNLQLVVPLMRGRGREAVAAQETSARIEVEASLLDLTQTIAELLTETANAYWNALAASRNLGILRTSETRGGQFVTETRTLIEADRVPRSEINQLNANLADRIAQRVAAEQSLIEACQRLALAMGYEPEDMTALPYPSDDFPRDEIAPPTFTNADELRGIIRGALSRRSDYLALERRKDAAGVQLTASRNQLLPQVDLSVGLGYGGLKEGRRIDHLFASQFLNVQGVDVIGKLNYTFPFANNVAKGVVVQRQGLWEQAEFRRQEVGRRIGADLMGAFTSVGNSLERLRAARESVLSYQRALQGERDKFQLGVASLIDLLSVEDRLTNAQASELSALAAFASSLARLRLATGTILSPGRPVQSIDVSTFLTPPLLGQAVR